MKVSRPTPAAPRMTLGEKAFETSSKGPSFENGGVRGMEWDKQYRQL